MLLEALVPKLGLWMVLWDIGLPRYILALNLEEAR